MNLPTPPTAFILLLLTALSTLAIDSVVDPPGVYSLENHATSHPRYRYVYQVNDPTHGNFQEKYESRDGEVVQGYYRLLQSDGVIRTVHYTADESGFHARVMLEPSVENFGNDVGIS